MADNSSVITSVSERRTPESSLLDQSVGISMFQGRHIENLIAEENRRREMEMAKRRTQNLNFID
jgi:hypothetical protein